MRLSLPGYRKFSEEMRKSGLVKRFASRPIRFSEKLENNSDA
ncbi:MAG: hypothetical protein QME81_17255 [bacterium]|nr:hypothetical protein [bacterium]